MTPRNEENLLRVQRLIQKGTLIPLTPGEVLSIHLDWVHHRPGGGERAHNQIMLLNGPESSCAYFSGESEEKAS